jgi:hypothetical protein
MDETREIEDMEVDAEQDAPTRADELPPDGWREMKAADLARLCKSAALAAGGSKAELIKRLETHYHGVSDRHANGRVVCPYCKAPARCNGTRRMSESIVRRTYRCSGKRRHAFTLDQ